MKKGQITMFMIIGIVLIVIFASLFAISEDIAKQNSEKEVNKIIATLWDKASIDKYITSCLESSAKEAIKLAIPQGGSVYSNQAEGGRFPAFKNFATDTPEFKKIYGTFLLPYDQTLGTDKDMTHVMYGIMAPLNFHEPFKKESPKYPYEGNLDEWAPPKTGYPFREFEDKRYSLSPLCSDEGENAYNLGEELGLPENKQEEFMNSCNDDYGTESVQEYLELYINQIFNDCTDFEELNREFGFEYEEESSKASVLFGDSDTLISMDFPVTFHILDDEPVTRHFHYTISLSLRIKEIVKSAHMIIERDGKDPWFNITEADSVKPLCYKNEEKVPCFPDSDFSLKINRDVCCENCGEPTEEIKEDCTPKNAEPSWSDGFGKYYVKHADIITITDKASIIDGKPLKISFARANRRPALQKIKNTENEDWDIVLQEGERLKITPEALDPDEDRHHSGRMDNVTYSGWLQDHKDVFACGNGETPDDCFNKIWTNTQTGESLNPDDPIVFAGNVVLPLMSTETYTNIQRGITNPSSQYPLPNRDVEYVTTEEDIGAHKINVKACDTSDLCDEQEVIILVYDQPRAIAKITNYFDYNTPILSNEDPITLDASSSIVQIGDGDEGTNDLINIYTWEDITNNRKIYEGASSTVYVPRKETQQGFPDGLPASETFGYTEQELNDLIENIKDKEFKSSGEKRIRLTVKVDNAVFPRQGSTEKNINLKECTPYSSSVSPYPYNKIGISNDDTNKDSNPFLGSHSCCDTQGSLKSDNEECYTGTFIGEYEKIKKLFTETYSYGSELNDLGSTNKDENNKNDIWKIEVKRKCDALRGNICGGTGTYTLTVKTACDDEGGNVGMCSGPKEEDDTQCTDYTDETFESVWESAGNNLCDNSKVCRNKKIYEGLTCNGNGKCEKPVNKEIDCSSKDGCYYKGHAGDANNKCDTGEAECMRYSFDCRDGNANCISTEEGKCQVS